MGWVSQIRRPVGNVNALWTINTFANIDEVVEDPAAGDGATCKAEAPDDNEEQIWSMDDVDEPYTWSIDQVVLKFYCWRDEEPGLPDVRIKVNTTWSATQVLNLPDITVPAWVTLTYNGTWNKADFEADFQVGVKTAAIDGNEEVHIDTLYAIVHGYTWRP